MIKKMKNDLDKKILICGKDFFVASCSANLYIGVALKLNQGTTRKRAVIVFGRLFCSFFGGTKKKNIII